LADALPAEQTAPTPADSATRAAGATSVSAIGLANALFIGVAAARDILLAKNFGVTHLADAFAIASTLPELFQNFLTAGLIANAFIPVLARQAHRGRESQALAAVSLAMRWTVIVVAGMVAISLLAVRCTMRPFAPGAGAATIAEASRAALLLWPAMPLLLAGGFAAAVMQHKRRFVQPALAPVVYTLPLVLALLLFNAHWGIVAVAAGALIGAAAQLALQWRGVRDIVAARRLARSVAERQLARHLLLLALPIALTQIVAHLGRCIGRAIATTQGVGGVAALTYAFRITVVPVWVVAIPVCVVFLPAISSRISASASAASRELAHRALSVVLFITVPMAVLICIFRFDLARILLERGAFGPSATELTGTMVGVFALSIVPQGVAVLMARMAYARSDPTAPLKAAGVGVMVEGVSAWVLAQYTGLPGIAVGSFLGWSVHAGLLAAGECKHGLIRPRNAASYALMPLLPVLPLAAVALSLRSGLFHTLPIEDSAAASLGAMLGITALSGGVYLLAAAALRLGGYQELHLTGPVIVRALLNGRATGFRGRGNGSPRGGGGG
jgi:putative peptidoglycan lipid II flippase